MVTFRYVNIRDIPGRRISVSALFGRNGTDGLISDNWRSAFVLHWVDVFITFLRIVFKQFVGCWG